MIQTKTTNVWTQSANPLPLLRSTHHPAMADQKPNAGAAAPAGKVVFNPYAKKKCTTSASAVTSSAPSTTTTSTSFNKRPWSGAASKSNTNSEQKKQTIQSRPNPPDIGPLSTFSQAFGGEDPDASFGEEERAQQRAFDEALASSTSNKLNANKTTSNNATTSNATQINQQNLRDHHALLQPHILHVSTRQRGNPILAHIRNVPYQFSPMVPDYIFATTRCALYLSLRYHNLHPNYIHRRIAELKSDFELRVLLCHVDLDDNASVLLFLNDLCVQNNLTLILAWSEEEAARYVETFKAFDGKDASLIQKKEHTNYIDQISHVLGSVRSVNKTDSSQLLSQFGTWKNLVGASVEELSVCPGVGVKKVRRLYEAFHRPFSRDAAKRRKQKEQAAKSENEAESKSPLEKQPAKDDGSFDGERGKC